MHILSCGNMTCVSKRELREQRSWREQEREGGSTRDFFFSWAAQTGSFSKTMPPITIFFQESSIVRCEKNMRARRTNVLFSFFTERTGECKTEAILNRYSFLLARRCDRCIRCVQERDSFFKSEEGRGQTHTEKRKKRRDSNCVKYGRPRDKLRLQFCRNEM